MKNPTKREAARAAAREAKAKLKAANDACLCPIVQEMRGNGRPSYLPMVIVGSFCYKDDPPRRILCIGRHTPLMALAYRRAHGLCDYFNCMERDFPGYIARMQAETEARRKIATGETP